MTTHTQYVIRGGVEGRERLRILARTLQPSTAALFERLGIGAGMRCLDVGCGGGDVTLDLARRVGPGGRVVGVDIDEVKLSLAREEAAAQGLANVAFRLLDVRTEAVDDTFDVVYARFLLTHLDDPAAVVTAFFRHLRPGGLVIVEDMDANGHFMYPESAAFARLRVLYDAVVRKRGGDPTIGPRLPLLLRDAGFAHVDLHIVQPMSMQGEAKLITPLTLETIADTVITDGLASRDEINALVEELYAFAADPRTVAGVVRVVQAWGMKE